MYKLDQQASTLAVEYNNRKAFRTMSRAVYDIEGILNECSTATNSLKNPVQFSKF